MNVSSAGTQAYSARALVSNADTGKLEWGELNLSGFLEKVKAAREKGASATPMRTKQKLQELVKQYDPDVDKMSHEEYKAFVDGLKEQGVLISEERMTLMGFTVLDPANLWTGTLEPTGGSFSSMQYGIGSIEEKEKAWKADYLLRKLAEQYNRRIERVW